MMDRFCQGVARCLRPRIGVLAASVVLLGAGTAAAQYSTGFEPPGYVGDADGEILTAQDLFYIPAVAGSTDGHVFDYAANVLGLPANPGGGGLQFAGCEGPGAAVFVREQRDIVYPAGAVEIRFDFAAHYDGVLPSAQNVGSFSLQPSVPTTAYFIALPTWTDPVTAANWNVNYQWFDALGAQLQEPIASMSTLAVNHWYRWSTIVNFTNNQIVRVQLTDLTSLVVTTEYPEGRYLRGGSAGNAAPTAFRLFGGSGTVAGNTTAWDNVVIAAAPGGATAVGACCFDDLGNPCDILTAAACGAAGGLYAGNWNACSTCLETPASCGKGAEPCDTVHASPGCSDELCCTLVCAADPFCCSVEWEQNCIDEAVLVGCVCLEPDVPGAAVPASDDYDSYADGFLLTGVNGWSGWGNAAAAVANVSNDQSLSAPNSVEIDLGDDQVQQYSGAACEGQWTYSIQQYIPSTMDGQSYFIMLNTYVDGGAATNWSVQVWFDNVTANGAVVHADLAGTDPPEVPLITDEWVEIRVDIDLDNNSHTFNYGGTPVYTASWTDAQAGGGDLTIDAVDLYANGATAVYYDDLGLAPAATCPWDCQAVANGSVGINDLLDLLAQWGGAGACNFDGGAVGITDLLKLLANWGPCP